MENFNDHFKNFASNFSSMNMNSSTTTTTTTNNNNNNLSESLMTAISAGLMQQKQYYEPEYVKDLVKQIVDSIDSIVNTNKPGNKNINIIINNRDDVTGDEPKIKIEVENFPLDPSQITTETFTTTETITETNGQEIKKDLKKNIKKKLEELSDAKKPVKKEDELVINELLVDNVVHTDTDPIFEIMINKNNIVIIKCINHKVLSNYDINQFGLIHDQVEDENAYKDEDDLNDLYKQENAGKTFNIVKNNRSFNILLKATKETTLGQIKNVIISNFPTAILKFCDRYYDANGLKKQVNVNTSIDKCSIVDCVVDKQKVSSYF